jgi:putative flippase GtrA
LAVAWLGVDFAPSLGASGRMTGLILLFILPIISIIGLWLSEIIGKKILFVHQAGKYVLAGSLADVIDIKIFQFLFFLAPFSLIFKGISFLVATAIKYFANKQWAFQKPGKEDIKKEAVWFFLVTLIGLSIDIVSFYYFSLIKLNIAVHLWQEISIIFAALVAAIWNFIGYKFIVFKK